MKLILDEGLPLRAADLLRKSGLDARHVLELDLKGAADQAILARAARDGATIVTLDADFHRILAQTAATAPSVIRVRIEGLTPAQLSDLIRLVVDRTQNEVLTGAIISVGPQNVRVRRLPIRR